MMFALEVTEELESWPEKENHDRKWVSMLTKTKGTYSNCSYQYPFLTPFAFPSTAEHKRGV